MKISKRDLYSAGEKVNLSGDQLDQLWETLKKDVTTPFSYIAYYLGAAIVIAGMAWLMAIGIDKLGFGGLFGISILYALIFFSAGYRFWEDEQFRTLGGILLTLAVCMTPFIIFSVEKWSGIWPGTADLHMSDRAAWMSIEIGTMIASLLTIRFFKFPLLILPFWAALWVFAIDFSEAAFVDVDPRWVTLWFGLFMLVVSFLIDRRTQADYSFFGYFFGLLAFWGSLTFAMESETEKVTYLLINILLLFVGVLLQRSMFLVFAAFGILIYFIHFAYDLFPDSVTFAIAVSLLGVAIMYLGVLYHKHSQGLRDAVKRLIPEGLKKYLP